MMTALQKAPSLEICPIIIKMLWRFQQRVSGFFSNPSMMMEPEGSMEELVCIFCGGEAELTGR